MSRSRISIIGLVIIAILFLVLQATSFFNGQSSGNAEVKQQAAQGDYTPSDWAENIGNLLAPFAPKVKLDVDRFSIPANASVPIAIPSSDRPIRIASFELDTGNKALLTYQNAASNPLTDGQADNPLSLPRSSGKRPSRGSILAGKEGGTLLIQCQGSVPCQLALR
jgi:hypothetical protein